MIRRTICEVLGRGGEEGRRGNSCLLNGYYILETVLWVFPILSDLNLKMFQKVKLKGRQLGRNIEGRGARRQKANSSTSKKVDEGWRMGIES